MQAAVQRRWRSRFRFDITLGVGLAFLTMTGVVQAAQTGAEQQHGVSGEQQESDRAAISRLLTEQKSSPSPWSERPFAVNAILGIATPVGGLGISAEYSILPELTLAAGAGTNLFGLQLAALARCRFTPHRTST